MVFRSRPGVCLIRTGKEGFFWAEGPFWRLAQVLLGSPGHQVLVLSPRLLMATVYASPETTAVESQTPTAPPLAELHAADPPGVLAAVEPLSLGDRIGIWVWVISMLILLGLAVIGQFVYYFGQV